MTSRSSIYEIFHISLYKWFIANIKPGMQQMCMHDLQELHWTHGLFSTSLGKYSCKQMLQMLSSSLVTAEEVLSVHCWCCHCLPFFVIFLVLSVLAFLFAICFFFFSSLCNCFRTFSSSILFHFSSLFTSLSLIFFCFPAN